MSNITKVANGLKKRFILGMASIALVSAAPAFAQDQSPKQLLLSVDFAPRTVSQIEVGDFHFLPGQPAPIHYHAAPVIGYVSKGTIYYQVEGEAPQILKPGDAFYEPVGPRIMHFDNASKTEEAVFTDFNLEEANQPFIIFPTQPTEKIDRRSFPTALVGRTSVKHAEAYAQTIGKTASPLASNEPIVGYVAQGAIALSVAGSAPVVVEVGHTFFAPAEKAATIASVGDRAKIVSFFMR